MTPVACVYNLSSCPLPCQRCLYFAFGFFMQSCGSHSPAPPKNPEQNGTHYKPQANVSREWAVSSSSEAEGGFGFGCLLRLAFSTSSRGWGDERRKAFGGREH